MPMAIVVDGFVKASISSKTSVVINALIVQGVKEPYVHSLKKYTNQQML